MFQKSVSSLPYYPDTFGRNVTLSGNININAGAALLELYFTPKSESLKNESKTNKQGKYYESVLKMEVPQNREEVDETIQALKNNFLMLIYKDKNGKIKLLPNMRLEESLEVSNKNAYTLEFIGKFKKKNKFWDVADFTTSFTVNSTSNQITPTLFTPPISPLSRGCIQMTDTNGYVWRVCIGTDGALESTLI
jgi:hypothetical protein